MQLKEIYRPIQKELKGVEQLIKNSLKKSGYKSISEIGRYLLDTKGKRLRPALVILSAKAINNRSINERAMISLACAVELVHAASLIHDDVIDHATARHHKPTINLKYGQDVAITLGDYLYSKAFELVSNCGSLDILSCISQATRLMCEGQLIQVCERDNLELLKQRYFIIVKKKTAALFAASCQAGAMLVDKDRLTQNVLKKYGLNFGIAFQIIDDYLDIVADEAELGKDAGQDIAAGEMTLPLLNLLESVDKVERRQLQNLLETKKKNYLKLIRNRLLNSDASLRTKKATLSYINSAKERLDTLPNSDYRQSLLDLADYVLKRGFSAVTSPN